MLNRFHPSICFETYESWQPTLPLLYCATLYCPCTMQGQMCRLLTATYTDCNLHRFLLASGTQTGWLWPPCLWSCAPFPLRNWVGGKKQYQPQDHAPVREGDLHLDSTQGLPWFRGTWVAYSALLCFLKMLWDLIFLLLCFPIFLFNADYCFCCDFNL